MFISFASSLAMNIILALCIRNGEERKMKKVQQERGLGSYIIFLSSILCCKKKKSGMKYCALMHLMVGVCMPTFNMSIFISGVLHIVMIFH